MPSPTLRADDGALTVHAHRGFAGVAPENTIGAATLAAERFDADWIEIDVQPTADGTPVCFHDPGLGDEEGSRALTDASGLVRGTPTDEVLTAEVMDSGETVPTLADFLDALPAGIGVNVELKSPGGPVDDPGSLLFDDDNREEQRELWDDFVADVAPVLAEHASNNPVLLSSFFEGALAAARERLPDVDRALITAGDLDDGLTIAARQEATAIHPPADGIADVGASFVERAHDADLTVTVWTVETWRTCRDLAAAGVDGVIADYPFLDASL